MLLNISRLRNITVSFIGILEKLVYIKAVSWWKVRIHNSLLLVCKRLVELSRLFVLFLLAAVGAAHAETPKMEEELAASAWIDVAQEFGVRATLLYAIALSESGIERLPGTVSPWPYTIRTPVSRYYADSEEEARAILPSLIAEHGLLVDVGLGQINLRWNGDRVDDYGDLFDPIINLETMAEVLKEALDSTEEEAVGVGRYHTWKSREASSQQGARILGIEEAIIPVLGWSIPGD